MQMEKNQRKIDFVLSSKGYDLEKIDIATNQEAKHKMRELLNNPKALPPQIFNDDVHCGVRRTLKEILNYIKINLTVFASESSLGKQLALLN